MDNHFNPSPTPFRPEYLWALIVFVVAMALIGGIAALYETGGF